MTDREFLLASVLADTPQGPAVVLSGRHEQPDLTPSRAQLARRWCGAVVAVHGANTREEAESVLPWPGTDLTVITSAFHQLRAFLTFVQVLGGQPVRVWNLPVPGSMDRLGEEFAKIAAYQARGHVASYLEGRQYWEWRNRA